MNTTVAEALPGWKAYVAGNLFTSAFYNTIPLDSSYVGVFDRNAPSYMPKPLFGQGFGAVLAAGFGGDVWLTQSGLIPASPSFVSFWTTGPTGYTIGQHDTTIGFAVNGQNVGLAAVDWDEGWTCWRADMSAFAGTVAEIRFSLASYYIPGMSGAYEMYLDGVDITGFPVPEPTLAGFTAGCATLLLAFRTCRFNHRFTLSSYRAGFARDH